MRRSECVVAMDEGRKERDMIKKRRNERGKREKKKKEKKRRGRGHEEREKQQDKPTGTDTSTIVPFFVLSTRTKVH